MGRCYRGRESARAAWTQGKGLCGGEDAGGQSRLRGKGDMTRERQCGTGVTDDIRTIQLHVRQ